MKKTVIILLIALLAITLLAGCGGTSNQNLSQNNATSTETTPSSGTAGTETGTTSSTTATDTSKKDLPRELEYTKGSLPGVFERAVDDGFIVVVAFYNNDEYISQKVSDTIDEVVAAPDYKDQIRYFSYEISGKTSAKVAKLTTALGAKYTPNLTIIDGDKNIVFEDSGYIEFDYFEHALYNTVYKDKSPESN